jgi:hypothetical protein
MLVLEKVLYVCMYVSEVDGLTGLISRYHGSLGLSRSMITSSYSRPSSFNTMCARCAHGHLWLVYNLIFGAFPLT